MAPLVSTLGEGSIFSKSTDRAVCEAPREAEPRRLSSIPIQKWPAPDPPLERPPQWEEIEAEHVRRIYKKEKQKNI